MSTHENSRMDSAHRHVVPAVLSFVWQALIEPIARWRARRATLDALRALDDRMLADIGITRSEIDQVAYGRFPGRVDGVAAVPEIRLATSRPKPLPEMKRAA